MLTSETIVAAIDSNNPAEIKKLQKQGLKLIWQDERGTTLLHFAASKGKEAIVDYLLRHQVHPDNPYQYTTEKQDKDNLLECPPLLCAVTNKHIKVAELLLNAGANIHQESRGGLSPLGAAKRYYHTEMNATVREQRKAILDLLETHEKKEKIELEKKYASCVRYFNFQKKEELTAKSPQPQNSGCTIL